MAEKKEKTPKRNSEGEPLSPQSPEPRSSLVSNWAKPRAKRGKGPSLRPTCLDPESGLYHGEHFELSLKCELERPDQFERPLGLIVVALNGRGQKSGWSVLGQFLKNRLRRLDMASRLKDGSLAVLLPRTGLKKTVGLLQELGQFFDSQKELKGWAPRFGAALIRPSDGQGPSSFLAMATKELGLASEVAVKLLEDKKAILEADTALVPAEKASLFDGFQCLRAEGQVSMRPQAGPGE
jgi:hypothetical protein